MNELFSDEREKLKYEIEAIKDDIESSEIEFIRIEKFLNLLDKLPGSSLIEKIDRDELYDLRKYYLKFLKDIKKSLEELKEYLQESEDRMGKLTRIQIFL